MHSSTTLLGSPKAATERSWPEVVAENERLQAELAAGQRREKELEAALVEMQAENQRLRAWLSAAQAQLGQLVVDRNRLEAEVKLVKQKPFKAGHHSRSEAPSAPAKKRGRPAGHQGSGRKRPARVDYTEFVPVGECCPDCGTGFTGAGVERQRTVEDIEPIRPTIVTRYLIERRWCPRCQKYQESPVTTALPNYRLGLHVMLFVVYQKVALGLSYPKIQQELATYFGLRVTTTTLINLVTEVAQRFGPAYARLVELMRQQAALHIDETTWPVDGHRHWLWIFINDVVSLYVLSHSRGSKVPKALLGHDFAGVIISDFFSAYAPLEVQKAKCWAHLLRDSHALTKGQPPPGSERVQFHQHLHHLFLDMGLALEQAAADDTSQMNLYQDMHAKLLAFTQREWQDPDCQRLAARILKHLPELLLWLRHPAVAPDNNQAERGLRPAVVTRKTSFGSRSKRGAQAFARLLSLIRTWDSQDLDFFETARASLSNSASLN